ncbi:hypothetical protein OIDMADRAFT_103682 [Oidiodendron maius Zn]|uniref:CRAL-TRIO domain-containing protein n=1 Tax=Oidiodendron maius (strain Zn) TaxID=913774 RepID=A0A0C3CPL5_OIDMZ|nr:hypothetical protein OIDMADRAFT_103682 [Oidiodendron maius Zn]
MPTEIQPGRPETLTKEEEEKLRELWIALFKLCGVSIKDGSKLPDDASSIKTETKEKKKRSLFRRVTGGKDDDDEPTFAPGDEDKYGLNKVYETALKSMTPSEIRESIWGMVKIDNPDAILLRFLRARKWDVQKSLVMMISTMKWRTKDMLVDEDIMKYGELINIDGKEVISPTKKKLANDFMSQLVMGKSFLHGLDKEERPMCFIRVRLHKPGAQSNESLERFTVYQIETTRLMMLHPVDTANICFDMTDFGLSNLDYAPIKFIIKCFEANYPESLGVVLIHKAPWIFQGIWKIIKGWLDPVVAAKVHFTNSKEEMQEYIDINRMTPELEGEEKWEYKYIEPVPGENDAMKDTATRDKLQAERNKIVEDYEKTTAHWLNSSGEEAEAAKAKRTKLAGDLRDSYWQMDPYIRARSLYDRMGVIQPGGKINFYPWLTESTEALNSAEKTEEKINGSAVTPAAAEVKTEAVNGTAAPVATEEKTVTPNGAATAETVETAA